MPMRGENFVSAAISGGKHLYAVYSEDGQYGDGEQDDAQPAYPLRHAAPEEQSVRQDLHLVQNGGSCAAYARHRFEECVRYIGYIRSSRKAACRKRKK